MAVILAAGRGARLTPLTDRVPKALVEVRPGLTLIELAVRSLEAAGVDEFVIVAGYMARKVESAFSSREDVSVVRNPEYWRENGFSLLRARETVGGRDFVLVMADHLFEPELLTAIGKHLRAYDGYDTGVFACDSRMFWAAEELAKRSFAVSVSDCVNFLISHGVPFRAAGATGLVWADVDTHEALRHAREHVLPELLRRLGA